MKDQPPLCVDLDGTLLRTDTLAELALAALKNDPFSIFPALLALQNGRASLKRALAGNASLDVTSLPVNAEFLDYLKCEQSAGRRLILVTGADSNTAEAIAAHTGLFSEVLASDGSTNLTGENKARILVERFGKGGFDYAGNETRDLKIWAVARRAVVVNAPPGLAAGAAALCEVEKVFPRQPAGARDWIKALRVHQWCKNALLILPLVGAHRWNDLAKLRSLGFALLAFCLCASSVYMLNDLLDLSADRHHPGKRNRPFASGRIPLASGMLAAPLLLLAGTVIAWVYLPAAFFWTFAAYYVLTLSYSLALKDIEILDVFVLTGLYGVRVMAGGAATNTPVSYWLLVFSFFFFLSLAFAKRFTELQLIRHNRTERLKNRGYQGSDIDLVGVMGVASGYLSVLVLALYVTSPLVTRLYQRPAHLSFACPVLLYWISRVWLLAHRGELHNDPIIFALKDKQSWMLVAIIFLIGLAAHPI